ncbi:MAG: hypothetical protein P4L74_06910 [Candidatus Doudnabacteria bacterium]|nr:hypothetical protein [Candidatus Doudnabacteria bacterium]
MDKKTKKATLDSLAAEMNAGFGKVGVGIEKLARITTKGFENTAADIKGVKSDVQTLQTDVSDIKLRLDNLAPKFEVKDLEKRVRRLEVKTGIRQEA